MSNALIPDGVCFQDNNASLTNGGWTKGTDDWTRGCDCWTDGYDCWTNGFDDWTSGYDCWTDGYGGLTSGYLGFNSLSCIICKSFDGFNWPTTSK